MACMNKGWEILSGKIKSLLKRKKGIENRDNSIAEKWEILNGKNNWEGSFGLRSSTIPHSLWPNVSGGLDKNNPYKYDITKYVYAASVVPSKTQKVKESTWIGFVGVATDEEIFGEKTNSILVHKGFYSIYTSLNEASDFNRTTSARDQVLEEVKRLLNQYKEEEVSITATGHSLGSSLATLYAIDIVVNQNNKEFPVTAFVYACPRVGEENFKEAYGKLKTLQILRISNASDPVPKLPESGLIDGFANDRRVYEDVGFELSIDTTKSKYLKKDVDGHILEVYLHGTAGTQGAKGEFKLEINRDIALKNKADDVLKDEYGVPVSWCIEKNKGMVQQEDGYWILMDHEDYDTYFLP
ncbi:hypothetical protein CQW23_04297 [Capsicum baccatum]|uniref:Phospholipase A1 n=1 Tax=Capsicum baccatum TaxID=33114 RepID=A0A2G2XEP4_CAPBA|nr:hypothetical protein CQW23_04297 [Capsicum baccatum]